MEACMELLTALAEAEEDVKNNRVAPISETFDDLRNISDLADMSAELNEHFEQTNRIDQAIFEAEKEVEEGAEPISLNSAMGRFRKQTQI